MRFQFLLGAILALLSTSSSGQTVIDYQTWNPSSPPCNLFGAAINVPATVNGSSSTKAHQTNIGQPVYNTVNKNVDLLCSYNPTGAVYLGTQYQVANSFQAGYSYVIKVNAAVVNSGNVGSNASLVLNISNGGGSNTSCTGAQTISPSTSGNLIKSATIGGTTYTDYTLSWSALPTGFSHLTVGSVCPIFSTANSQTVKIRKITITAVPPAPTFTIAPATVPVTCGATVSQTFTVNNVYGTPGVTLYTWNLGANNNWLYNGNPAPATFSTGTTNNITLTTSCASALSNISASVTAGGTNYNTTGGAVSVSAPVLSVTGSNSICTTATYSVNAPCNATVTWSAPGGLVTLSPNGSQVTVTRLYDGMFNLIANVSACGGNYTASKNGITSGVGILGSYSTSYDGGGPLVKYPQEGYNNINQYSYVWAHVSGSPSWSMVGGSISSWNYNGYNLEFYLSAGDYATFRATVTSGGCTSSQDYTFIAQSFFSFYSLSPNPSNADLSIYVDDKKLATQKDIKATDLNIEQVIIVNKFGNTVLQQKFSQKTRKVSLNVNGLSPDIYVAKIFNGKTWVSIKFAKQ